MKLWFVGTAIDEEGWMVDGCYFLEAQAASAAKSGQFIVLGEVDGMFPANILDAEKAYSTMKLWFVGTAIDEEGWMVDGCYFLEAQAASAAKSGQFIVLGEVGGMFPANILDAEKAYYPNEETWENSILYKHQKNNVDVPKACGINYIPKGNDNINGSTSQTDCDDPIRCFVCGDEGIPDIAPLVLAGIGMLQPPSDSNIIDSFNKRVGYGYRLNKLGSAIQIVACRKHELELKNIIASHSSPYLNLSSEYQYDYLAKMMFAERHGYLFRIANEAGFNTFNKQAIPEKIVEPQPNKDDDIFNHLDDRAADLPEWTAVEVFGNIRVDMDELSKRENTMMPAWMYPDFVDMTEDDCSHGFSHFVSAYKKKFLKIKTFMYDNHYTNVVFDTRTGRSWRMTSPEFDKL